MLTVSGCGVGIEVDGELAHVGRDDRPGTWRRPRDTSAAPRSNWCDRLGDTFGRRALRSGGGRSAGSLASLTPDRSSGSVPTGSEADGPLGSVVAVSVVSRSRSRSVPACRRRRHRRRRSPAWRCTPGRTRRRARRRRSPRCECRACATRPSAAPAGAALGWPSDVHVSRFPQVAQATGGIVCVTGSCCDQIRPRMSASAVAQMSDVALTGGRQNASRSATAPPIPPTAAMTRPVVPDRSSTMSNALSSDHSPAPSAPMHEPDDAERHHVLPALARSEDEESVAAMVDHPRDPHHAHDSRRGERSQQARRSGGCRSRSRSRSPATRATCRASCPSRRTNRRCR